MADVLIFVDINLFNLLSLTFLDHIIRVYGAALESNGLH